MKLKLLLSLSFVLLVLLCVTALAVTGRDGAPPASLELMEGASVRLDPAHPGLRFETRVKTSELKALDEPYEIGTLILPTDLLTGALTVETEDALRLHSGMQGVRLREAEDGYTYFYAALTDLLPQNYARRFSAVSYIRIGETYYYTEYDPDANARSIAEVALTAYSSESEENLPLIAPYLDRVLLLDDSLSLRVPTGYASPFAVGYAEGVLTVTAVGDLPLSELVAIVIGDRVYTGGWSIDGRALTAPLTHTVTFSVLGESVSYELLHGETPVYGGKTDFTRDGFNYRIVGWSEAISPATCDVTYTAEVRRVYSVRWVTQSYTSNQTYLAGELATPPAGYENDVLSSSTVYRFLGWDRDLAQPLPDAHTGNVIAIRAQYESSVREYSVSLTVDGEPSGVISVPYGTVPSPTVGDIPKKEGYTDVLWLSGTDSAVTGEGVECVGYRTLYDSEQLLWAYGQSDLSFDPKGKNDNRGSVYEEATGLLYLLMELRGAPKGSALAPYLTEKIVRSLSFMMSDGGCAPFFSLEPYWCYVPLTAVAAVAKETPAVWDRLSDLEREKYDFMMACFAYILTYGNDDHNSYRTGPGYRGNFHKSWNPNYRLANVTPMLFVGRYFGSADAVDALLLAFDYDATVAKFTEYGWARALKEWTADAPVFDDGGAPVPSQKETMENGGKTYFSDGGDREDGGSGVGVRTAFTYGGHRVDEVAAIFNALLAYNYSGGTVVSEMLCRGSASAEWERAYILDGTRSPYEGLTGMMLELGKENRSSVTYASDDFVMVCTALAAFRELGMYELETDAGQDNLFRHVWIGNQDFLYKIAHGYKSFATSSTPHSKESYESERMGQYLWRSWWEADYGSRYTLETLPPEEVYVFDPLLYDQDFEGNPDFMTTTGVEYDGQLSPGMSSPTNAFARALKIGDNTLFAYGLNASGAGGFNLNLTNPGGLTHLGENYTKLRITLSLAIPEGSSGWDSYLRLRAGGNSDVIKLLVTSKNGKFSIAGVSAGKLTCELQTIVIEVDMKNGLVDGFVDGRQVVTDAPISVPAASNAENLVAWMATADHYLFNWYHAASSTGEGATRIHYLDDLRFEALAD